MSNIYLKIDLPSYELEGLTDKYEILCKFIESPYCDYMTWNNIYPNIPEFSPIKQTVISKKEIIVRRALLNNNIIFMNNRLFDKLALAVSLGNTFSADDICKRAIEDDKKNFTMDIEKMKSELEEAEKRDHVSKNIRRLDYLKSEYISKLNSSNAKNKELIELIRNCTEVEELEKLYPKVQELVNKEIARQRRAEERRRREEEKRKAEEEKQRMISLEKKKKLFFENVEKDVEKFSGIIDENIIREFANRKRFLNSEYDIGRFEKELYKLLNDEFLKPTFEKKYFKVPNLKYNTMSISISRDSYMGKETIEVYCISYDNNYIYNSKKLTFEEKLSFMRDKKKDIVKYMKYRIFDKYSSIYDKNIFDVNKLELKRYMVLGSSKNNALELQIVFDVKESDINE